MVKTSPSRAAAKTEEDRSTGWGGEDHSAPAALSLVGLVMARAIAGRLLSSQRTSFMPSRSLLLTTKFSTGLTGKQLSLSLAFVRFMVCCV